MPSVATYWCGDEGPCQFVLENLDKLIIRSAYSVNDAKPSVPEYMTSEEKAELVQKIKANPHRYVGQERLSHSLTPAWVDGKLKPWHLTLRSFQLQTADGIEVLPGGLARVSPKPDLLGRSPTSGQMTQDCWIVSDEPIDHEATLLSPESETIRLRRSGAELPSRVAEHLFWLGRYTERCESIARLLRTTLTRLAGEDEYDELSEMPHLVKALAAMGQLEPDYAIEGLGRAMPQLDLMLPASVFDCGTSRGLQSAAVGALRNASAVRDRISLDAYRILRSLHNEIVVQSRPRGANVIAAIERLNHCVTLLLAFSGLSAESLTRTHGWRFVLLGRRIERAHQTAELLNATMTVPLANESNLCEAILDATDSLMTYRSRYLSLVQPAPTIDLLVTDESNPRSLRFQLQDIEQVLLELPTSASQVGLGADERIAADLMRRLLVADIVKLTQCGANQERGALAELLEQVCIGMPRLANALEARYLIHTSVSQSLTGEPSKTLPPLALLPPGPADKPT
ncbi:circularly permuted type 2 ATP-grasp protein [Rhodopirellula sallentina]|uniref:circularly permuted type 2 ATP-grasp protein n=1 Tax=Rhodopirellula sallentina TaxID=1263869 RepID=UPI0021BBBA92|nr:circularly permuted type 2 ATP-grasp protein [Rhodopirellula sallentina]